MEGDFETTDLYLAAWLLSRGATLVGADGGDPRRVAFTISPPPTTAELVSYTAGTATTNVDRYARSLRFLKRQIYAAREGTAR